MKEHPLGAEFTVRLLPLTTDGPLVSEIKAILRGDAKEDEETNPSSPTQRMEETL